MLLLFDLDGVLVSNGSGDTRPGQEILRVHPHLEKFLQGLECSIGVLSHRSRGEVLQILDVLDYDSIDNRFVFTANDIAFRYPTPQRLFSLVSTGLRKSRILKYLEVKHRIEAAEVAFVDDRRENALDMHDCGVGLSIQVPPARFENGAVFSYDPSALGRELLAWRRAEGGTGRFVELPEVRIDQIDAMFSGRVMVERGVQVFSRIRKIRRLFRNL